MASGAAEDAVRRCKAIAEYQKNLLQHKELESRVLAARENLRASKEEFAKKAKNEDDLKSLQSVGQIIGKVRRPLNNERLIVKASSGGARKAVIVKASSKVDEEVVLGNELGGEDGGGGGKEGEEKDQEEKSH
ncbi:hypothetical protein FEM48_Zijuj09G0100400 [Ziziphus jujuba var. spinosa]|uniref:Uncharacterized protein n=1 Tax=Ziziphus jujuba var. spinosa TaxID=714518 RepID=A0A978USC7_ZIZJJ|nr:hypothetical protein FEM48_Zijuj09G0100400 [Ziziphus jujuba var. spinosa]